MKEVDYRRLNQKLAGKNPPLGGGDTSNHSAPILTETEMKNLDRWARGILPRLTTNYPDSLWPIDRD